VTELLVKAYGQLIAQTSLLVVFICGVACSVKYAKLISTHYVNLKKIFGKKYAGFSQHSCNA
jgi:hypothetical protein